MVKESRTFKFSWKWLLPLSVFFGFTLFDIYGGFFFDHLNLTLFWIPLYCWTIYRPDFVNPAVLVAMGFFYDSFLFMPAGLHALLYLCFYCLVFIQRQILAKQPFLIVWSIFFLLMIVANWIVHKVTTDEVHYLNVLLETVLEGILYPIIIKPLFYMKKRLVAHVP